MIEKVLLKEKPCVTKQETRKIVRAWIWFWYNDVTRLAVLLGVPAILAAVVLAWLGVDGEARKNGVLATYVACFMWALLDNDYSQLNRIGLTVYRRPLATASNTNSTDTLDS